MMNRLNDVTRFNNATTLDIYEAFLKEGFIPDDVERELDQLKTTIYATFTSEKREDETQEEHLRAQEEHLRLIWWDDEVRNTTEKLYLKFLGYESRDYWTLLDFIAYQVNTGVDGITPYFSSRKKHWSYKGYKKYSKEELKSHPYYGKPSTPAEYIYKHMKQFAELRKKNGPSVRAADYLVVNYISYKYYPDARRIPLGVASY